jgi:hypothetical protein
LGIANFDQNLVVLAQLGIDSHLVVRPMHRR